MDRLTKYRKPPQENQEFLTMKQVAERLQCHINFVRKEIREGRLGHTKLGRHVRIHRDHLDKWLRERTFAPALGATEDS